MKIQVAARLAQMFGVAVIDQIVLSGASFAVGFLLIRQTSDTDYGLFVLVQSSLTLVVAAQYSWLSGPLAAVAFKQDAARRRVMVGSIRKSQQRFLGLLAAAALVIPAILWVAHLFSKVECAVLAIAIVGAWAALRREYLRSVTLMYQRPRSLLVADFCYVLVLMSGALLAAFGPLPAAITATAALAAAAYLGGTVSFRQLAKDPGWEAADAGPVWREIRVLGIWSTVGAVIYWLYTQSYVYVLASHFDLAAVASVNAARLLMMPAIVLTVGIYGLLTPSAAAWLAEFGLVRLMRRLMGFIVGISILDLGYFAIVWYFRDWLTSDLLHKSIADRDRLLLLWAGVALIGLVRDILQCALLALRRQQVLAWLVAVSAIASLGILWFGLDRWGPAAALIGQIAGEIINLVGLIALLTQAIRLDSSEWRRSSTH